MWKFCEKAQFLHSFGQIPRNFAETVPFRKISTHEIRWNYGILRSDWQHVKWKPAQWKPKFLSNVRTHQSQSKFLFLPILCETLFIFQNVYTEKKNLRKFSFSPEKWIQIINRKQFFIASTFLFKSPGKMKI